MATENEQQQQQPLNSSDSGESWVQTTLKSVLDGWQVFSLDARKQVLAENIETVSRLKESSIASRKSLGEKTREFKNLAAELKQTALGPLIKAYQDEIDSLYKRCTTSDEFFLSIANSLTGLIDPARPLLIAINKITEIELTMTRLAQENSALKGNITNYESKLGETGAKGDELAKAVFELSSLKDEKTKILTERNNALMQVEDLKGRIQNLIKIREEKSDEVTQIKETLSRNEIEFEKLKLENNSRLEHANQLDEKLRATIHEQQTILSEKRKRETEIEKLLGDITILTKERDQISNDKQKITTILENLQTSMSMLEKEVSDLKVICKNKEIEFEKTIIEKNTILEIKQNEIETQKHKFLVEIEDLQKRLVLEKGKVQERMNFSELENLFNQEKSKTIKENDRLTRECQHLNNHISELDKKVKVLESKISELEEEKALLVSEKEKEKIEFNQIKKEQEHKCEKVKEENNQLQLEIDSVKSNLIQTEKRENQLVEEIKTLNNLVLKLDETIKDREKLIVEVKKLKDSLFDLENDQKKTNEEKTREKNQLVDMLDDLRKKLKETERDRDKAFKDKEKIEFETVKLIEERNTMLDEKNAEMVERIKDVQSEKNKVVIERDKIKVEKERFLDELRNLKERINDLKIEKDNIIDSLKGMLQSRTQKGADLEENYIKLLEESNELKQKHKELEDSQKRIEGRAGQLEQSLSEEQITNKQLKQNLLELEIEMKEESKRSQRLIEEQNKEHQEEIKRLIKKNSEILSEMERGSEYQTRVEKSMNDLAVSFEQLNEQIESHKTQKMLVEEKIQQQKTYYENQLGVAKIENGSLTQTLKEQERTYQTLQNKLKDLENQNDYLAHHNTLLLSKIKEHENSKSFEFGNNSGSSDLINDTEKETKQPQPQQYTLIDMQNENLNSSMADIIAQLKRETERRKELEEELANIRSGENNLNPHNNSNNQKPSDLILANGIDMFDVNLHRERALSGGESSLINFIPLLVYIKKLLRWERQDNSHSL